MSAGTAACKAPLGRHSLAPAAQCTCKCASWQQSALGHGSSGLLRGLEAQRFVQVVLSRAGRKDWAGVALRTEKGNERGTSVHGEQMAGIFSCHFLCDISLTSIRAKSVVFAEGVARLNRRVVPVRKTQKLKAYNMRSLQGWSFGHRDNTAAKRAIDCFHIRVIYMVASCRDWVCCMAF